MDDAEHEAAQGMLDQIADALGIPVETFLAPMRRPVTATVAAEQEEQLLRLFRKVRDAEMRERLLDCMRAAADKAAV